MHPAKLQMKTHGLARRKIPVTGHRSLVTAVCALLCALPLAQQAAAQAFPARNLQMIVPYTPGGSADLFSRVMAQKLGEAWGRTIIVENRPGASGMIGTEIVTKAPPDGYMLLGHTSSYPATASVLAKLPFDPARGIVPVAMTARAPMLRFSIRSGGTFGGAIRIGDFLSHGGCQRRVERAVCRCFAGDRRQRYGWIIQ